MPHNYTSTKAIFYEDVPLIGIGSKTTHLMTLPSLVDMLVMYNFISIKGLKI